MRRLRTMLRVAGRSAALRHLLQIFPVAQIYHLRRYQSGKVEAVRAPN